MKSERISIFNYEAFYLDHLEGNLSEEDTVLLLAFLEEHLDLVEEEDDFILLDSKDDTSIFPDKDSLKIVSDEVAIVLSNAEHFLIAEAEGQLTEAKQKELNSVVSQHPHLEKERAYLAVMFLKADTSIVYAEKSGLKRKGAVIFWPYIALAAASILIAFFFVMNNGQNEQLLAEDDKDDNQEVLKQEAPIHEPDNVQLADDDVDDQQNNENSTTLSPEQPLKIQRNVAPNQPRLASVNTMKRQQARRVINSIDNQNLQPVATHINPPVVSTTPEDDFAQVAPQEMKNPIKPITSRLGKTLKTDVEFKTGKAANNTGAGFFLKIGKLEISRKKGKRKKD